jgi:MYXO-CTERM domain-containing protein
VGQQFTVLTAGSINDHGFALGGPAANSFSMMIDGTSVILQAITPILFGDYNQDGFVNAADYVVYRNRKAGIGGNTLPNDAGEEGVTIDDYRYWKAHYGETLGNGSAATTSAPEPGGLLLAVLGAVGLFARRRIWNRRSPLHSLL